MRGRTGWSGTGAAVFSATGENGIRPVLCACSLQRLEHACWSERHATQTYTRRIENGIRHRREQRLADRLAGAVVRKIRPVRIGIAVHDHDIDLLRRIRMPERRMSDPVHPVVFSVSNCTSSCSARLNECSMPHSTVRRSASGLITRPQSCAQTIRFAHTRPVCRFTSTSTTCATTV